MSAGRAEGGLGESVAARRLADAERRVRRGVVERVTVSRSGSPFVGEQAACRTAKRKWSVPDGLLHLAQRVLLQLAGVGVEAADALAEFIDRHRVRVVQPAERLLVEMELLAVGALRCLDAQPPRQA